jgi:Zn-dependent peptidase ImmA (M78 family)/DNA-binding XRE family transcriptional regulator
MTQRDLADAVGLNSSTIALYERERLEPTEIVLEALGVVLGVQPKFFLEAKGDDEFQESETNFRSLATTTNRLRKKMLAHATLFGAVIDHLSGVVVRPQLKLRPVNASTPDDIERAAEALRIDLGLGIDAPILDVTHMAEHAGAVVTVLDAEIGRQVDAFSRYGVTNVVVLNPAKGSATRARFDVAHEIAHGVLHRDAASPEESAVREKQADRFASALLMPQRAFAREFWSLGKGRTWQQLLDLKQRWGASVPAIVVRAYQLGLIDAADYQRRFKYMGKLGWLRGDEPNEPEAERPQLFSLMLERFQSVTRKSAATIANDMGWNPETFERVTGVPAPLDVDKSVLAFDGRQRRFG